MDVGYMSTPDVSMTFSDDQLSVTVTDDQLTNGLGIASQSTKDSHSTGAQNWLPSTTDIPTVTSTSLTPHAVTIATSSACSSTRFKVEPTSSDQSVIYHQLSNSTVISGDADSGGGVMPVTAATATDGTSSNNNSSDTPSDSQLLSVGKPNKKVSFPEGEALIKGFAHAPNPWYNVSFCTTENLLSAYINSCNAHSVRPLTKLINQLKCISDFGERINLLTLKGENLNCKHIETLEEIFRRVQFNTVDMESTHLDDESAIALFEMVEYYESVVHLKISHNRNLGLRAWVSAARMLRKTQHLESIDLRGCSINEQCMTVLGRAIKIGACIRSLYLQECNLSGRGVLIICAALRSISTIKELHIGDNNLQPSDGIQLGNLIRNNTYLHTLDVRNNHLQDIGIAHICDGLAEQPNGIGLKSLNISSNHFSPASMNVIAIALSRTKSLNTLNVSYNNLTNEGFFVLKEGLLKNKSLCRLALRATKISDEGAVALAEYIADSYTISQLDLRDNDIKTAGLLAVSMCLKVQETITRLEIDQHVKKEPAVKDYAAQQRFFIDELQSKVTQNAELQRAKLEKLLVQSKSEKTGTGAVVTPAVHLPAMSTGVQTAPSPEQADHQAPDQSKPSAESSQVGSCSYFDPLGAVSVDGAAEGPVQNGAVSVDGPAEGPVQNGDIDSVAFFNDATNVNTAPAALAKNATCDSQSDDLEVNSCNTYGDTIDHLLDNATGLGSNQFGITDIVRDGAANLGDSAANLGESAANLGESAANLGDSAANLGDSAANLGDSAANLEESAANLGDSAANLGDSAANLGDHAANLGESAANLGDSAANLEDSAANLGDSAANLGESAANLGNSAANLEDSAANLGDSAANLGESAANLGESAANLGDSAANLEDSTANLEDSTANLEDSADSLTLADDVSDASLDNAANLSGDSADSDGEHITSPQSRLTAHSDVNTEPTPMSTTDSQFVIVVSEMSPYVTEEVKSCSEEHDEMSELSEAAASLSSDSSIGKYMHDEQKEPKIDFGESTDGADITGSSDECPTPKILPSEDPQSEHARSDNCSSATSTTLKAYEDGSHGISDCDIVTEKSTEAVDINILVPDTVVGSTGATVDVCPSAPEYIRQSEGDHSIETDKVLDRVEQVSDGSSSFSPIVSGQEHVGSQLGFDEAATQHD